MNKSDLDFASEDAGDYGPGPTSTSGPAISQVLAPDEVLMPDEGL